MRLLSYIKALLHSYSFLKAWWRSKPVTLKEAQARLTICYECEHLDMMTGQCQKCWCFVHLKVKWADEKCPLRKWF